MILIEKSQRVRAEKIKNNLIRISPNQFLLW